MKKSTKKCAAGLMCLSMAAMNLLAPSAKLLTANLHASAAETPIRINSVKKAPVPACATVINIGEQKISNGLIKINISKSGSYVLTGSNFINEAYVDVQILVDYDVEADIWIDDLNIKNDDAEYLSTGSAIVIEVVPWVINGTANIHIQSDSEIVSYTRAVVNGELNFVDSADGATLNMNREKTLNARNYLFSGEGKVNIKDVYSLNFGDTSSDSLYTYLPINIYSGNVSFGKSSDEIYYNSVLIDGGKVSGLTGVNSYYHVNSNDERVFEREFSGLPESTEIVSINRTLQSYMYTDGMGELSNIWVEGDDVDFFTEEKAYSYTYVRETYSFTGPTVSDAYKVSFVDKDTNEVIFKQYALPGGTVALPQSEKYDYAFAVGDDEFTAETPVDEDITVTVTKTLKKFSLKIDGVETIVDYGTKLPNGVYIERGFSLPLYGGCEVTRDLDLKKTGLDSVEIDGVHYASIGTADELDAFANLVNIKIIYRLNGYMTNDIVANSNFFPIGYYNNEALYCGIFNGNGHSVTLDISIATDSNVGLFGRVTAGTKISNLVIKGSVDGLYHVGSIAGSAYGSGTVTIENCMNYASITSSEDAAGIIAYSPENVTLSIINCANVGSVVANYSAASICSWIRGSAAISNCYNYGTVLNEYTSPGTILAYGTRCLFDNCYTLETNVEADGVTNVSTEQFASGEIAHKLNEKLPEGASAWMQTIGTDAYPVLFGNSETQSVYYGYLDCDATEKTYVNVQHDEQGHSYDSVVTPPTCTEGGYTTHTCKYCDGSYTDSAVEKLGHAYGEWHVEGGKIIRTCECGETQGLVEAVWHSIVAIFNSVWLPLVTGFNSIWLKVISALAA